MAAEYLYYPAEFPEPPVSVKNIAITFDFKDSEVVVTEDTTFEVKSDSLSELKLNAKNLIIKSIKFNSVTIKNYTYKNDIITVPFRSSLKKKTVFRITSVTCCKPTDNILEGLYYDYSPENGPRTIISQCQQWGFQRFAPCIDDMRMKCTWKTTIIADKRYLNLISNGNVARPRTSFDHNRDTITYVNSEPMPPYLFFIGVGTWDTYSRDFLYPDGSKVTLELLVLPGAEKKDAETALDIMADAILWTHIFTGPEKYDMIDRRQELYDLCRKRYLSGNTPEYTAEIEALASNLVLGYQYPYEVYREIAMQNSDFGGMENTGNTTIIASRILPGSEITDASYEYLFGVKQHEFYHNLNGSSVTGDTPFSIWLNEAVTVMMEDNYLAFHFGEDYNRLCTLMQMYAPGTGTFSLDTGKLSMPIEPEGFNDPNDLITSVTYVKAPEFTRMIEAFMGKPAFAWALDIYHKTYAKSNASPRDWLKVMEEIGKIPFSIMADGWLKEIGYPTVTAKSEWHPDTETAEITVTQTGFREGKPWIFPLSGMLLDENGEVVTEFQHKIDSAHLTFQVNCGREFSHTIWNLNHAAYIRMVRTESDEELYRLLKLDCHPVTKFLTFNTIYEREMIRILENPEHSVSENFVDAFMEMLNDHELTSSCGALPFTMFEDVNDARFTFAHMSLYQARQKILRSIAEKYSERLHALYESLHPWAPVGFSPEELSVFFKKNAVRNLILSILSSLDGQESQLLAKYQYEHAKNATERLAALSSYLSSSADDRMDILKAELERSSTNPVAFENFLSVVAGTCSPDTVNYLKVIESSPAFHKEQAGFSRSLYLRFAQNRKLSLETETGRKFLEESIISLAEVNSYITTGMLSVFSHMNDYNRQLKEIMHGMLIRILSSVSLVKSPAVYQTVKQLLQQTGN